MFPWCKIVILHVCYSSSVFSSGKIHIAEGYSCMLSSIERLEGDDSGVGYTHDMLIRESSILTQDAKGDNFRLACVTDQKLGKFSGSNVSFHIICVN